MKDMEEWTTSAENPPGRGPCPTRLSMDVYVGHAQGPAMRKWEPW